MTGSAGSARAYALHLLRYRGRSEKELRDRLRKKGFDDRETENAVASLKESGFINDRLLAENLTRQAVTNRLLGFEGARRFLYRKGIPGDVIKETIEYNEEVELQNIRKLAEKKERLTEKYAEPRRTRSLMGFLARKGFSASLIRKALKNKLTDEEAE